MHVRMACDDRIEAAAEIHRHSFTLPGAPEASPNRVRGSGGAACRGLDIGFVGPEWHRASLTSSSF
ncbi:MAG: hypothetical protein Kow0062_23520 [Acidobacteriota bacterium]